MASKNPSSFIDKVYDILLNVPGDEQDKPIEHLLDDAIAFRNDHPESVEIWIACALAHLVYAGDRFNPTQQLRYLKVTRKELETAVKIDKQALGGLATAYLGLVYNMAPPWPLSYGNKRKAGKL